jgi:hypothetical protein
MNTKKKKKKKKKSFPGLKGKGGMFERNNVRFLESLPRKDVSTFLASFLDVLSINNLGQVECCGCVF